MVTMRLSSNNKFVALVRGKDRMPAVKRYKKQRDGGDFKFEAEVDRSAQASNRKLKVLFGTKKANPQSLVVTKGTSAVIILDHFG